MSGPRIPRRPQPFLLGLALLSLGVALVACKDGGSGDGGSPTPAPPEPRVLTSDDGLLTLTIPPGAVEDDLEIAVTAIPEGELPAALSELAGAGGGYRLQPDGLELASPATVTLELDSDELVGQPGSGTAAWALISLTSDGQRSALDSLQTRASLGDRSLFVSGRLSHFSQLGRTRGSLAVTLEAVRPAPSAGETFAVSVTALNAESTGQVLLNGMFGHFTAADSIAFSGVAEGAETAGGLPDNAFALPFDAMIPYGEGVRATAEFTCEAGGPGSYGVEVFAGSVAAVRGQRTVTGLTVILDSGVACEGQQT